MADVLVRGEDAEKKKASEAWDWCDASVSQIAPRLLATTESQEMVIPLERKPANILLWDF